MDKKNSFLAEVDTTVREALADGDAEALVSYVKEVVVESFKNGIKAGLAKAHKQSETQSGASVKVDNA